MTPDPDEEQGFFRRHRAATSVAAIAVVAFAVVVTFLIRDSDTKPTRKVQEVTIVKVLPPPPPPPPPQQIPQPKMTEQTPIREPEQKMEKPLERPKEAPKDEPPPGPLGLDAKGEGPGDSFGLAGNPGGGGLLGGGGGGGSRFGWYAGMVQQQIDKALRENEKTRNLRLVSGIKIWPDGAGRITRVELMISTGNPETDALVRSQIMSAVRLTEPPPKGMDLPLNVAITGRGPG